MRASHITFVAVVTGGYIWGGRGDIINVANTMYSSGRREERGGGDSPAMWIRRQ